MKVFYAPVGKKNYGILQKQVDKK